MMLTSNGKGLLLRSRNPDNITSVIPRSKKVDLEGHNVVVYNGVEEVKVLQNMGISVPTPIKTAYKWPGRYTPLTHQIETAAFIVSHRRGFVLNEMGTMKTASALWAIDYMMQERVVNRVLIVAPLSTLERVWHPEAFQLLTHRQIVVLHGSRQKRLDLLASDWDIAIINFDGLKIIADEVKKDHRINMVIVDEAAAYRNAQAQRYKIFKNMLRDDVRLMLMTGTPCPNTPTDAWALTRLVSPDNVPKYFGAFQESTMVKVTQFKWRPRPDGFKIAYAAMQPAVRFRKEDCLTLPPVTYQDRECKITPDQIAAYKSMSKDMVAELGSVQLTAVNAADKLNKLRQILCGSVRDTQTGEYIVLDHAPRVSLLLECIEEAGAKVIVIVPFKGILKHLSEQVSKHHSCAVINGDVSPKERNEIFRQFKEQDEPKVLLCHPKVMAHGLTLTEADMMVFYAPIYSNEEYQQVTERINRPGQTRSMTIIKIAGSKTEWAIYDAVESKKLGQENILDLYKKALHEY